MRARPLPPRGPRPWRAPAALLALVALLAAAPLAAAGPGLDPLAAESMLFYSDGPNLVVTSQMWTLIAPLTEKPASGARPTPARRRRPRGAAPRPRRVPVSFNAPARSSAYARIAPRRRRPRPAPSTHEALAIPPLASPRQGWAVHPGQERLRVPHARPDLGGCRRGGRSGPRRGRVRAPPAAARRASRRLPSRATASRPLLSLPADTAVTRPPIRKKNPAPQAQDQPPGQAAGRQHAIRRAGAAGEPGALFSFPLSRRRRTPPPPPPRRVALSSCAAACARCLPCHPPATPPPLPRRPFRPPASCLPLPGPDRHPRPQPPAADADVQGDQGHCDRVGRQDREHADPGGALRGQGGCRERGHRASPGRLLAPARPPPCLPSLRAPAAAIVVATAAAEGNASLPCPPRSLVAAPARTGPPPASSSR
jgi:hypothetical protein